MHVRIFANWIIAAALIPAIVATGQDSISEPDSSPMADSNERDQPLPQFPARATQFQLGDTDQNQPDRQSKRPGFERNELRGSTTGSETSSTTSGSFDQPVGRPQRPVPSGGTANDQPFDAQPIPPTPRTRFSNPARTGTTQDGSSRQIPPLNNPMQQLNPSRLTRGLGDGESSRPPQAAGSGRPTSIIADRPRVNANHSTRNVAATPSIQNPVSRIPESTGVGAAETPDIINTGYEEPSRNIGGADSGLIESLLATYDVSASQGALPGTPVALRELLQTTPVQSRMSMVQQYWETWFDWATLSNRREFAGWLSQIPNPRTVPEQLILQTAKSMADNEVLAAEIQLSRSQSKLRQLARTSSQSMPPLPLSRPLTSRYITHYDWYAQRQRMPKRLQGINEMLPRTWQLVSQRAQTVNQSQQTRDQARSAYSSGQLSIGDLLEAGRSWRAARRGFTGTVVSYNQAISDYALTIAPPNKPVDQIESMLVAKPRSVVEVAQRNTDPRNSALQNSVQPRANYHQESGGYRSQPATSTPMQSSIQPPALDRRNSLQPSAVSNSGLQPAGNGQLAPQQPMQQQPQGQIPGSINQRQGSRGSNDSFQSQPGGGFNRQAKPSSSQPANGTQFSGGSFGG